MDTKSDSSKALRLGRAKVSATVKTIRLLVFVYGTISLVAALAMTLVSVLFFHLNAPMAFAGSLVGIVLVLLILKPIKALWHSKFVGECQSERLWEEANTAVMEGGTDEVLAGYSKAAIRKTRHRISK